MTTQQTGSPVFTVMTGTGLDGLVELIAHDGGLAYRLPEDEIIAGARAANNMNKVIVDAIRETGLANDGELGMADVRDLNRWIREHELNRWIRLHGDDEDGEETGFHLVQNDGAKSRLYANNAVDTVADGIYHLGFEIDGYRFLNEDGNGNVSVETLTYWLNDLLADDLANGSLANEAVNPYLIDSTTGTGLDQLVDRIVTDEGLQGRISTSELIEGANAAADMNRLIIKSITETGVANDGTLNMADVRDMNAWLQGNRLNYWTRLHGDDEDGEETGFHLVQNDGAKGRLFGNNAVDTVADGIYHLGFEIDGYRFLNEDGNGNVSVETMTDWLNRLLEDDLADGSLVNAGVDPYVTGTTGTGLDLLVDMITADEGLNARISTSEINEGALAANRMNRVIVESIKETGVADDGQISSLDMHDINAWLRDNEVRRWTRLHGDDEDGEETGFHLVQNDGASTRLFGNNAIDTVADGLYHIGFELDGWRFLNEDGNGNVGVETAAHWLNELLADDLAAGTLHSRGSVDVAALRESAVYRLESVTVDGPGDQVEVDHDVSLELGNGTFAFSFVADEPEGWDYDTLFSKDARDYGDGGHIGAWVRNNEVVVRLQGDDDEVWLSTGAGSVQAGEEYDLAFSFGRDGAHLYLNGVKVDIEADYTQGLRNNSEDLAIGTNTWGRSVTDPDWRSDYFHGQIDDFMVFDHALSNAEIFALSI